jgi:hypothetical protein
MEIIIKLNKEILLHFILMNIKWECAKVKNKNLIEYGVIKIIQFGYIAKVNHV